MGIVTKIDGLRQIWEKTIDLSKMADNFASGQTWNIGPNAKIVGLAVDAADDTSAVTKGYVDSVAQGLDPKESVRAATTSNIDLSNPPAAIGGVTLSANDRVLVKDQTNKAANGIYIFNGAGTAMTRSPDADSSAEVSAGMYVFVEEGDNADTGWVLITDNPITLGTTELEFTKFTAGAQIIAGSGLVQTGNAFDVNVGKGLEIVSDFVDVKVDGSTIEITTSNAVGVKDGGITAAKLNADVVGAGVSQNAVTKAIDVNVDNSTIEINGSDQLAVKTGGIQTAHIASGAVIEASIANDAVTSAKIAANAITATHIDPSVAGDGIAGGGGTALSVDFVREFPTVVQNSYTVTLSNTPVAGSEMIFLNGLVQKSGSGADYTIAGTTVTFADKLKSTDVVMAWYLK